MARITRTVRKNNSELEKYIITGPTEQRWSGKIGQVYK